MDNLNAILIIAVMSLGTLLLRGLPFLIFSAQDKLPDTIVYLGKVLPSAVLGMLVIYCWKDINILATPHGFYELTASLVVILVQVWRRNMILSIIAGTAAFMLLQNLVRF